jgi:hypothetical protein
LSQTKRFLSSQSDNLIGKLRFPAAAHPDLILNEGNVPVQ